ncbi:hypothetical protein LCGC14_2211750 [marine sediment metagenome]|uniref:Uncharacterized protein n=1 Tax=marine sediment metagenome TaxID=412755 RepID=A0A0F9DDT6_9ZZZZ
MTTNKATVNSVASDTAALTEILDRQLSRLDKLSTRAVARLAGAIRPLERVMTNFRTQARTVLVARWLKRDRAFTTVDKSHSITFGKETEVVIQERESMQERPTALKWLKVNKPELYNELTTQRVTLADGAALVRATNALVRITRKSKVTPVVTKKLVEITAALLSSFTAQDVLHKPSVEAAVAEKRITVPQLQKLYKIETIHALLVNDLAAKEKK